MRSITWDRLRAEILSLYEPPLRAIATYRQMRQILTEFGSLPSVRRPNDLSPPNIAVWIRLHPERSPARTASLLRCLSAIATYALHAGHLRHDPFDFRSPGQWVRIDAAPPARKPAHRSAADIGRLLDLLDSEAAGGSWEAGRLQALVYTYAFTGLRKCEALTLEHADIDLTGRSLTIRPKVDWRPKTIRSAARLPLADPLADVLARWLPRTGCQWVFPGRRLYGAWTGGPAGHKAIDAIRSAGERAGVPGVTPSTFRKSVGTLAKFWGVSQLELKGLLRHTTVETQKYYDEEDAELLRAATAKIQFPRIVSSA
jgi:integrase